MLAGRAFGAARPAAVDVPFVTVPGTVAAMRHATAGDTVADEFLAADVDHTVAVRAAGVGTGGVRPVDEAIAVVIQTVAAHLRRACWHAAPRRRARDGRDVGKPAVLLRPYLVPVRRGASDADVVVARAVRGQVRHRAESHAIGGAQHL